MYMYYRHDETDIKHLKKAAKYRIHAISHSAELIDRADVHVRDFGGDEKIWFLCDKAEQISKADTSLFSLYDFEHRDDKQLFSNNSEQHRAD